MTKYLLTEQKRIYSQNQLLSFRQQTSTNNNSNNEILAIHCISRSKQK
jgi:hypothetical protein